MALSVVEFAAMPDIKEYATIEEAANDPDVPYTAYWVRKLAQDGKIEAIFGGSEGKERVKTRSHASQIRDYWGLKL